MAQPGELDDVIDFKPFFDMIVGILFVLLILVAAQMFFTQWGEAGRPQQQARLEWQREITAFLDDVAQRLRGRGLSVSIDQVDRTIATPLGELVTPGPEQLPRPAPGRVGSLGQALVESLSCLTGGAAPADCPAFRLLHLGQLRTETRVASPSPIAVLSPDRYASLVSTLLNAALLEGAPSLLAISGSAGGPALQPGSSVVPAATAEGISVPGNLAGDFALRFVFDPLPQTGP
jgi:hypothetical protein